MTPATRSPGARQDARSDYLVIGAGIVGLAVARELRSRHPEAAITVLEREPGVAAHQTGHNSGVIHSGIYYAPGSLKARLCVEGARLMFAYCAEQGIPHERAGKLIIARDASELPALDELERRGIENGVPGLRRLSAAEIPEVEPLAAGIAALHSPGTGIVDYAEVCRALERELRASGVAFRFGADARRVGRFGGETLVHLADGSRLAAGWVVACAGLWSDRLAEASGADPDPRIVPFRGAYLHLVDADAADAVRGMIYPVPDPDLPFLGVHITRHIDGGVSIGPTAFVAGARDAYRISRIRLGDVRSLVAWPGLWRVAAKYWRTAGGELRMLLSRRAMLRAAAEYSPALAHRRLRRGATAGVRAQAVGRDGRLVDDFVFSELPGATHVRNAPSPAATSAFALAREIVDRAERAGAAGNSGSGSGSESRSS